MKHKVNPMFSLTTRRRRTCQLGKIRRRSYSRESERSPGGGWDREQEYREGPRMGLEPVSHPYYCHCPCHCPCHCRPKSEIRNLSRIVARAGDEAPRGHWHRNSKKFYRHSKSSRRTQNAAQGIPCQDRAEKKSVSYSERHEGVPVIPSWA